MYDARIAKCLTAKRESRSVEFKEQFLPADAKQSLEILKDIVAIANSGGGTLVVGIRNSGEPSGVDVSLVLDHDHAKYCDLIRKYTLQDFCDFEVVEADKDGHTIAIFLVNAPDYPLVFERVGTYPVDGGRQQTAFSQGTVFFRHGAKSEPGTSADLQKFMQDRMREMEKQLVKGLRKVSVAPRGAQLEVVPSSSVSQSHPNAVPFRLTHDPTAQGVVGIDRGRLCPYRQKEVIAKLKERLPSGPLPSTHDIWAINKVYNIEAKEELAWKPEFSSRQYSDAFIDWVVERIQKDQQFLPDVRQKLYEMTH